MKTMILKLSGMHCISCSLNIDSELEDIPGILTINTSYPRSETKIMYDEKLVTVDLIKRTIEQLGYAVDRVAST